MSLSIGAVDILCEFIEISIHNILYATKVYPETIFKPKRSYGIVVYQSIHPQVNEYITQCLKAVHFYLKRNKLNKLYVSITDGQKVFTRYVFDVIHLTDNIESDPFLLEVEKFFRDFYVKLHTTPTNLGTLPDDVTFNVQIHTTEYSSMEFNQEPLYEDFLWIDADKNCSLQPNTIAVSPLHTIQVDFLTMQIYFESLT